MSYKIVTLALMLITLGLTFTSCEENQAELNTHDVTEVIDLEATGELTFTANGEDFVSSGFVSSDGWQISFNHVYVTITNLSAYQTDPPYDPHTGDEISSEIVAELDGVFTIDLVQNNQDVTPVTIGTLENIPVGFYNALSWNMVPAENGPAQGYTIYIDAQASKEDQSYNVFLGFEHGYRYTAGEFVGDVRKGFVTQDNPGDLEITFHFDHIFGDFEQPADSDLNMIAIGFEPFAEFMQEGTVQEDLFSLSQNLPEETYTKLLEALSTLGHTGEAHCFCTVI